jgi:2-desacetyl-2-hydroxyethyl bacteriochlorophyllide A dehydrogenase
MNAAQTLYFARPFQIEIRNEPLPPMAPHQVTVQTVVSAISAGTELLFYRGQVPSGMAVDATIAGMGESVQYPLTYGYCSAGEVVAVGAEVDPAWLGRRVFAFHPHASAFVCEPAALLPIPDSLSYEQAVFLPYMETAVNFVMDARPLVGGRVLVMGLGIVGLLTSHLLQQFPIARVIAIDTYAKRRALAETLGIKETFSPDQVENLQEYDPDLILELSSNPTAMATAIQLAGYGTRIVVGSWYGDKIAHLPLGGKFHRNRVQIISSQVSTIDGQFRNRWSKARRLQSAWAHLHTLPVNDLISHRLPITSASEAYQLLDQQPDQALQILFTYQQT